MPSAAAPTRQPGDSAGHQFTRQRRLHAILGLVLLLLIGVTFLPALQNGFVNFDDVDYVLDNPHVKAGLTWSGAEWALTATRASNWHPLTWLSHMLDCELFGLNPSGHHLTSVLIHALNALLVFLVFSSMTGEIWRSFFVAAIFAVHPLRVESVAWIAERKDVLSLLFWLLALWSYCSYVNQSKIKNQKSKISYGLTLLLFALGLMAKPSVVTLPFVLLLLDYWPFKRNGFLRLVIEKIPFFLLSIASSAATFYAQQHGGAVETMSQMPLPGRVANVFVAYARYLGKTFWPVSLSAFYTLPERWPAGVILISVILVTGISIGVVCARARRPFLLVGWFWFLGTLVPMIGLVQVGLQSMADRYTYIPGLGLLIMLVWSVPAIASPLRLRVLASAFAVVIVVLCAVTGRQVTYWKDSETLFRHALAVGDDNFGIRIDLGNALAAQGRMEEAIAEYQQAVHLQPKLTFARERLAAALRTKGRLDEAIAQFEEILKLDPSAASAQNEIGAILFDQGHLDEAITRYRASVALDPNAAATYYNWGIALCYQGHYGDAVEPLQKAVALQPDNPRTHYNLGIAFFHTDRVEDAIREFKATLALEPNAPKTHYRLGVALAQSGHRAEAAEQFRAALVLQPNYPEAEQELQKITASQ